MEERNAERREKSVAGAEKSARGKGMLAARSENDVSQFLPADRRKFPDMTIAQTKTISTGRCACLMALCIALAATGCAEPRSPAMSLRIPAAESPAAPRAEDAATSEALRLLADETLTSEALLLGIRALLDAHPGSAGLAECWGQALERAGDAERAAGAYRRAVELDAARANAWLRLGILIKRAGDDPVGAQVALRRALEAGAPRARTLNELGVAYAQNKQLREALAVWKQALAEEPRWGVLYSNALKASLALGDVREARAFYEAGKEADEVEENLYIQWAEYLVGEKKNKEAVLVYDAAVARLPEAPLPAYYRAQVLKDLKRMPEARAEFERAARLDPDGPRGRIAAWSRRALFILENPKDEKEFQACVKDYFEAMRGDREKAPARLEKLLPRLDRLVAKHPDFWNAWQVRAWALRRLGRFDEARQALDRSREIYPDEPNAWHELGLLLREQGRLDEARQTLLHAHQLAPRDPTLLMNLALTEMDLARWDAALERIAQVERLVGNESTVPLREYYGSKRSGKITPEIGRPEVPITGPR